MLTFTDKEDNRTRHYLFPDAAKQFKLRKIANKLDLTDSVLNLDNYFKNSKTEMNFLKKAVAY